MSLGNPQTLWLLLLLPLLAAWRLRGRRRATLTLPSGERLADLPAGRARLAEVAAVGWRVTALALIVLALARPRWPDETCRIPVESLAIQVVLDVSGSMAEKDFDLDGGNVSRLTAAKRAFELLLRDRQPTGNRADAIGLVTFAASPESICPPTLSHSVVRRLLEAAEPLGTPPDSSTNIGDAMAQGLYLLDRVRPVHKVMVLLSDGEHNIPKEDAPQALKPRAAGQLAKSLSLRVHTIFAGPHDGSRSISEAEQALRDVAALTGGRAFRALDTDGLLEIVRDIDRMERTRLESFRYYRYREAYPWCGLAAVVLLWTGVLLESTVWRRLP